jgi:hypothetical protein
MQEALRTLTEAGGLTLGVDDEDLRILGALNSMFAHDDPALPAWILDRKPTKDVTCIQRALTYAPSSQHSAEWM